MELSVHPVQIKILKQLLFKPNSRFSDLNITRLTNDHFTFHVKRLLQEGLVEKSDNRYRLTVTGKEFSNRMDTANLDIEKQAKVTVKLVPVRKKGQQTEYLLQKRLKEPYFGFWGTPGGKVRWGEKIFAAARRELFEETGLEGKLSLKGVQHKLDVTEEGKLLEDKVFYVFRVDGVKGELKLQPEGGENRWVKQSDLASLTMFVGMNQIIEMMNSRGLKFIEGNYVYKLENY